jgi:alpha-L-fucosidase
MHCLTDAGLTTLAGAAGTAIGDSGYQGSDMTTLNKKQPGQDRTVSDLKHNTAIAVIRVAAEWANAHLENWRILATRYRDSLTRFDRTITAIAGLTMLNERANAWDSFKKKAMTIATIATRTATPQATQNAFATCFQSARSHSHNSLTGENSFTGSAFLCVVTLKLPVRCDP